MKTLAELNFVTLCSLYLFGLYLMGIQYMYIQSPTVDAQSSFTATLIGGETNGVTDVCCNGVVLDFDSVNPLNLSILDGEALFDPVLSTSYDNGNEYSSGYNVLGNIMPWMCITVSSECESAEQIPRIRNIGTAGMMNAI
jgi:hypothetical protein